MKKIDIHCHTTNHKLYGLHTDYARIEDILEHMRKYEIEKTVLVATYFPHKGTGVTNQMLLERIKGRPELIAFGSIDVENKPEQGLKELDELAAERKIKGIKLYPGYQEFSPSDEKMSQIYALAERYSLPVMLHTGSLHCSIRDQYNIECAVIENSAKNTRCKGVYCIKENMYLSEPRQLINAAKKFPKVNFIASHLGYPHYNQLIELLQNCPNVHTDVSGVFKSGYEDDYKTELEIEIPRIAKAVGIERMLFGTDFPIQSVQDSVRIVESLKLNASEKEMMYYKTAAKLLRLEGDD